MSAVIARNDEHPDYWDDSGEKYEQAIVDALADAKVIEDLGGSLREHEYVAFNQLIATGDLLEAGYAYQKFCRNALERQCKTAYEVGIYVEVCHD
jgi:hypothetical protein